MLRPDAEAEHESGDSAEDREAAEEAQRQHFAGRHIPEPATLWDGYETRTDALRENEQRVADDMTNRDLKLPPWEEPDRRTIEASLPAVEYR